MDRIKQQKPLYIVLLLTFLATLFLPSYMVFLRKRLERDAPEIWNQVTNNGSFAYVSTLLLTSRNLEEGLYAPKALSVYRYGLPIDPYSHERGLRSWIFDFLAFYPLAFFVFLARGNLQWGWVLAEAGLSCVWVYSFYLLFLRFSGERKAALFWASLSFFFADSLYLLFSFVTAVPGYLGSQIFHAVAQAFGRGQWWMRLPPPGVTGLFCFWALAGSFLLAAAARRRLMMAAALGLFTGLLCFFHLFEWMFGVAGLFFFFIAALLFRLPRHTQWNLGIASAVSGVISLAYFTGIHWIAGDVAKDFIERDGLNNREIYWQSFYFLFWSLVFFYKAKGSTGERRSWWLLWGSLQLSVFCTSNVQVIVGYDMYFYWHIIMLGAVAGYLALFCWSLERPRWREWIKTHAYVLTALVFAIVFCRHKGWAETHYKIFGTPRHLEAGMRWLADNTPKESLVLSLSGATLRQLPYWTQARTLVTEGIPVCGRAVGTRQQLADLALMLKTARVNPQKFLEARWQDAGLADVQARRWAHYNRDVPMDLVEGYFMPYMLLNVGLSRESLMKPAAQTILQFYDELEPLDTSYYLWINQGEESFLEALPETYGGRLVYGNPGVRIYAFTPGG